MLFIMAITVEQLTEAALSLPSEARALLADRLVESLDPLEDQEIQALWAVEAMRRRDEVRSGLVKTIPGAEALERVRRAEKQPGLEQRFIASVEAAIQKLTARPSSYAILEQDVWRCLTRVFPYAVLYTVEADFILIVAIMHCHQRPGYWRHRVTS